MYLYYMHCDYTSDGIIGVRPFVYPPIDYDYNLHILYSIIRETYINECFTLLILVTRDTHNAYED